MCILDILLSREYRGEYRINRGKRYIIGALALVQKRLDNFVDGVPVGKIEKYASSFTVLRLVYVRLNNKLQQGNWIYEMRNKTQRDCVIINKWYLKFKMIKYEEGDEQSECHKESLSF